jgi:SAM-dependent methyltransferase
MTIPPSKIQLDFDRIAALSTDKWNHNNHYVPFLLRQLPLSSDLDALEIGCGSGSFTRLMAQRFRRVFALDLSPCMIEKAKELSHQYRNIDFQVADAMSYGFSSGEFGCVASIATLHHMPFEPILSKMKNALKENGTFLNLDLFKAESLADYSTAALAVPVNLILRWIKNGQIRESAETRAAWAEHGRTDVYLPLSQVRRTCAAVLPKARIRRHLLWRYSIVWEKKQEPATVGPGVQI